MNIKVVNTLKGAVHVHVYTLAQCIEAKVDGSCQEGALEMLRETVSNQTVLLTKIIEKLNPTDDELTHWLGAWGEELQRVNEPTT